MKKCLLWILLLSLLSTYLSGCKGDEDLSLQLPPESTTETTEETTASPQDLFQVAMITDYYDITDHSFNQTTYEAGRDWCEEHNIPFTYYKPEMDSTEARVTAIEQAIREGANVLLLPGYAFAGAITETAEKYSDVYYIALDVSEFDLQDAAGCADDFSYVYPKNVFSAVYREEIAGFLAGYGAVRMGYTDLGFVGAIAVPAVMRYGYGFIQGADYAAGELGIQASVKYAYSFQCFCDAGTRGVQEHVGKWFKSGTQAVCFCGGGIYTYFKDIECPYDFRAIGVDMDMKAIIDEIYGSGTTLTSAMKNFSATIPWALSKLILEDDWDSLGGTVQNLGLVSGSELEKNHVALPDSTQWNDSFTREDYAAIVNALYTGAVTVDASTEQEPLAKHITVEYQGNLAPSDE